MDGIPSRYMSRKDAASVLLQVDGTHEYVRGIDENRNAVLHKRRYS